MPKSRVFSTHSARTVSQCRRLTNLMITSYKLTWRTSRSIVVRTTCSLAMIHNVHSTQLAVQIMSVSLAIQIRKRTTSFTSTNTLFQRVFLRFIRLKRIETRDMPWSKACMTSRYPILVVALMAGNWRDAHMTSYSTKVLWAMKMDKLAQGLLRIANEPILNKWAGEI